MPSSPSFLAATSPLINIDVYSSAWAHTRKPLRFSNVVSVARLTCVLNVISVPRFTSRTSSSEQEASISAVAAITAVAGETSLNRELIVLFRYCMFNYLIHRYVNLHNLLPAGYVGTHARAFFRQSQPVYLYVDMAGVGGRVHLPAYIVVVVNLA